MRKVRREKRPMINDSLKNWDYEWHVDAKTGDAWRLVKKESGYFGGRWWEDDDFNIVPFLGDNR